MKSIIITLTLLCSFSFFSQAEKTNQADSIKNVHLQEKREKGEEEGEGGRRGGGGV